jgi:hypothetical protein
MELKENKGDKPLKPSSIYVPIDWGNRPSIKKLVQKWNLEKQKTEDIEYEDVTLQKKINQLLNEVK